MAPIIQVAGSKLARCSLPLNVMPRMPELTNLTDRISHLRDRKGSSVVVVGGDTRENPKPRKPKQLPERKFATDYFMLFVYALLTVALVAQLALIIWLDVI